MLFAGPSHPIRSSLPEPCPEAPGHRLEREALVLDPVLLRPTSCPLGLLLGKARTGGAWAGGVWASYTKVASHQALGRSCKGLEGASLNFAL